MQGRPKVSENCPDICIQGGHRCEIGASAGEFRRTWAGAKRRISPLHSRTSSVGRVCDFRQPPQLRTSQRSRRLEMRWNPVFSRWHLLPPPAEQVYASERQMLVFGFLPDVGFFNSRMLDTLHCVAQAMWKLRPLTPRYGSASWHGVGLSPARPGCGLRRAPAFKSGVGMFCLRLKYLGGLCASVVAGPRGALEPSSAGLSVPAVCPERATLERSRRGGVLRGVGTGGVVSARPSGVRGGAVAAPLGLGRLGVLWGCRCRLRRRGAPGQRGRGAAVPPLLWDSRARRPRGGPVSAALLSASGSSQEKNANNVEERDDHLRPPCHCSLAATSARLASRFVEPFARPLAQNTAR